MARRSSLFFVAFIVSVLMVVGMTSLAEKASADSGTATITGVVTTPDGGVPDSTIGLGYCGSNATSNGCYAFPAGSYTYDQATGAFTGTGIPAGNYYFEWGYRGPSPYLSIYFQNGILDYQTAAAHELTVAAGAQITQNVTLVASGTISGTVSGFGGGQVGAATIRADRTADATAQFQSFNGQYDASTGVYSVSGLIPGTYTLLVEPSVGSGWIYKSVGSFVVNAGQDVTQNVVVDHLGVITGHLYVDDGTGSGPRPYQGAFTVQWGELLSAAHESGADGSFSVNVPDTDAGLCMTQTVYVRNTCWTSTGSSTTSWSTFHVQPNQTVGGFDITATEYGDITALLEGQLGTGDPFALQNGSMDTFKLNTDTGLFEPYGASGHGGNGSKAYSDYLTPGTYRVRFTDHTDNLDTMWWQGERYGSDADDIQVVAGQTVDLGDVVLPPRDFEVDRTYGQDRFAGAVSMSEEDWPDDQIPPDGVPIVYIANGLNYPDALSAGPAAIAQDGVLLLVTPTSIPSSVVEELRRLHPQNIVVVGGPASVSDAVLHELDQYVTGPDHTASRISGADRYEASRNLAEKTFGRNGAGTVFIATGTNYPDALSAGPAAGSVDAPVLLVYGAADRLDAGTLQTLSFLGTTDVNIVGGPASVSAGIESQLESLLGTEHVQRFSGADRYQASASLAQAFFPDPETAFVATGANFPDALAGAPLAGHYDGPIYLTPPGCFSQDMAAGILSGGDTSRIWLLGGPASLSDNVYNLDVCSS